MDQKRADLSGSFPKTIRITLNTRFIHKHFKSFMDSFKSGDSAAMKIWIYRKTFDSIWKFSSPPESRANWMNEKKTAKPETRSEKLKNNKYTMSAIASYWMRALSVFVTEKDRALPSDSFWHSTFNSEGRRKKWMKVVDNFLECLPGLFLVFVCYCFELFKWVLWNAGLLLQLRHLSYTFADLSLNFWMDSQHQMFEMF